MDAFVFLVPTILRAYNETLLKTEFSFSFDATATYIHSHSIRDSFGLVLCLICFIDKRRGGIIKIEH